MLKPTLDLSATDKEYTIAVEIPGVDEKDVKLEIANDTLTIRGEKNMRKKLSPIQTTIIIRCLLTLLPLPAVPP